MRKAMRRLLTTIAIFILLLGASAWWLVSYVAPEQSLNMAYEPIDVKEKALSMIKRLKPELILTEADVNHIIKKHLAGHPTIANGVTIDGASFELEKDRMLARLNVTYKDKLPVELSAVYRLEWDDSSIILYPSSLKMKNITLPLSMMEVISIPLDLPNQDIVSVRDVEFNENQIKLLFKIELQSIL